MIGYASRQTEPILQPTQAGFILQYNNISK